MKDDKALLKLVMYIRMDFEEFYNRSHSAVCFADLRPFRDAMCHALLDPQSDKMTWMISTYLRKDIYESSAGESRDVTQPRTLGEKTVRTAMMMPICFVTLKGTRDGPISLTMTLAW